MIFSKIVSVDDTGLNDWAKKKLEKFAKISEHYKDDPLNEDEVINRVNGCDALLVSWRTPITKKVIDSCTNLKYIGMCCSLYDEKSANVDIAHAKSKGIVVKGIRDYGDEGLVEFIISELIRLYHGFGDYMWSDKQEELTDKVLGIIGMGAAGQMLASRAQAFGMKVNYYSRTRKTELENDRLKFLPLHKLLTESDIVSTHLPKNSVIIDKDGFDKLGSNKILINTSLEPTFDINEFVKWINSGNNFAIMDRGALGKNFEELTVLNKVIYTEKVTGFTAQAERRLSEKVVENIRSLEK